MIDAPVIFLFVPLKVSILLTLVNMRNGLKYKLELFY